MFKWYKLITWIVEQRKAGFCSFRVLASQDEFIIWNPDNGKEFRIKY